MKHRSIFIAAVALPLLFGGAVLAEQTNPPQPGPMMGAQMAKQPSAKDFAAWHKSMCGEHFAHQTARLAYLQARLDLTEKQLPAFRKWADAEAQTAGLERDACLSSAPKGDTPPSIVEREDMMASHLRIKLQGLDSARPALQALYEVLTPEQRAILDRPHDGHGQGPRGFMEGGMGHGMMGGHHPFG